MSGDFLSRWSRRKLDVKRAEDAALPEPAPNAAEAAPVEAELSAEELAALPPIESLTAESDIAAFLRKGVPQALRNAALRRAWALDPEIRDYVGDARDYAYDWNVPGGVPGTGPLDPSTDVARMVEDVFGRSHEPETAGAVGEARVTSSQNPDAPTMQAVAEGRPDTPEPAGEGGTDADGEPIQSSSPVQETPLRARNRHGGAKPT